MGRIPKIIAFGDSLTYGYPFGNKLSWVALTEQTIGIPIYNLGSNGDSLKTMHRRILVDVIDLKPDICILMGGTNDVFHDIPLETMQKEWDTMVNMLLDSKILPLLGLPPETLDKKKEKTLAKFRSWIKKQAKTRGLKCVDFPKSLKSPRAKGPLRKYYEDVVHLNARGYEAMATAASSTLLTLLA